MYAYDWFWGTNLFTGINEGITKASQAWETKGQALAATGEGWKNLKATWVHGMDLYTI